MGNLHRKILAACALILTPIAGVQAGGDFRFPQAPVVAVPSPMAIAEYPTWYLRGDVGLGFHQDPDLSQSGAVVSNADMEDALTLGGGLGYFFTDNIRGDFTVDHRFETDITGTNTVTLARVSTDLQSTVLLGNLYYDFRGRDDVSPYIGVGVGMSLNQSGSTDTSRAELAAAAMAGLSYRLRDDWLVDAGYRFLYLGDARTSNAANVSIEDIMAHEIRVGVRYEFQ